MNESAPPASRRPGKLNSAIPGLCLFCANLLLGALMLGSFVRPGAFGLAPSRQPAIAPPTPTAGIPFDISVLPTAASTVTIATATPSRAAATPRASHGAPTVTTIVTPTPTPTPSVPTPTALPVSPTPRPTVLPGG